MHLRPRKRTIVVAATAGILGLGAPAAYAGDEFLSDNISNNDVSVPVNACGNNLNVIAAAIENEAKAECTNNVDQSGDRSRDRGDDIGSGNISNNDISVPVNACGNNLNVIAAAVENEAHGKCQNNVDQGGKKH